MKMWKRWAALTVCFAGLGGMSVRAAERPPGVAEVASVTQEAAWSWCYYGSYGCYNSAYRAARYLQDCGYSAKIVGNGSNYCVYYAH